VQHHVGIAVAYQTSGMFDAHSAQQKRAAFRQTVGVVANADSHGFGF
jgi:hypothetical protein